MRVVIEGLVSLFLGFIAAALIDYLRAVRRYKNKEK